MARLTGVATGVIDSSGLSEGPGLRTNRDWTPVDEKYADRRLYAVEPTVTAQIVNEMLGLALIYLVAIPNITQERHWKTIFREYIQLSWSRIGPTGIPRTTGWISRVEEGTTSRFGFYVTIPIEMLANDEFGADNLMDELKVVPQTCVYTIMQEVSLQLAGRPTYNMFSQQINGGGEPFTYGVWYELANRHFGLAAMNPAAIVTELTKLLTSNRNPKDTIVVPQGCQWILKEETIDNRVFPYHVRDYTKQLYQTAEALVQVGRGLHPTLNLATGEDILLVTMPTLQSTTYEPESEGLQPLQRQHVLAGVFPYEKPNYATTQKLHPNSSIVQVSYITKRNSGWQKIPQSKAIRETHLGYMFEESGVGMDTEPSEAMRAAIAAWGRHVRDNAYYTRYLFGQRDMNQPSENAKLERKRTDGKMPGFRDKPIGAHTINDLATGDLLDDDDGSHVEFVRQIGQFPEDHLSSQHLLDICRAIKRTGKTNVTDGGRTRSLFAQVIDRSEGYIDRAFPAALHPIRIERPGTDGADSVADQLAGFIDMVATQTSVRPDDDTWTAAGGAPARDTRSTTKGQVLKTHIEQLFTRLPNSSIELWEPYMPLFQRYEKEQKEATEKLFGHINEKIAPHAEERNEKSLKATTENLISAMKTQLIIPAEEIGLEKKLPVIQKKQLNAIARMIVPFGELGSAEHVLSADSPEWSYSRAFSDKQADTMDLDEPFRTAPFGAVAGLEGGNRVNFDSSKYPIDHTRTVALGEILIGIPSDELYMFIELLRLPNTVATHARLADLGIMLFSGGLVRLREQYGTLSLLVCRRDGETCQTIMAPIISTFSNRGMVTMADFKFQFSLGVFWNNPRAIDEMRNVFFSGVRGGIGTSLIRSIDGVRSLLEGGEEPMRGDLAYVIEPVSEDNHHYPIAIIPDMPISDMRSSASDHREQAIEESAYNRHSGFNLISMLISPGVIESAGHMLMESLEDIAKGTAPAFSPYVERQPTYYWNQHSQKYDRLVSGTGPRGMAIQHDADTAWIIYNGHRGTQFPTEAQTYIS
jgi:hypothetical protein